MKTLITITILAITSVCFAGEYIIEPTIPFTSDADGAFRPGSIVNPYVIIDSSTGQEIGIMESEYPDTTPGDGIGDAGTIYNPWIIRTND